MLPSFARADINKKTGNTSLALTARRVLPAYHLRRRTG